MTPAELLQLSGAYWGSCALHAGVRLDLFSHLDDQPRTARELAGLTGCDQRGLSMLLDALAALKLILKEDNGYRASRTSADFLAKNSPGYLGYIIQHHQHLMTGWNRLDEAVTTGAPVGIGPSHTGDDTSGECFLLGMFNMACLARAAHRPKHRSGRPSPTPGPGGGTGHLRHPLLPPQPGTDGGYL